MSLYLNTAATKDDITNINAYLRKRRKPVFKIKDLRAMDFKNDPLNVLLIDIIIRGRYLDFKADEQALSIETIWTTGAVNLADVGYVVALNTAMEAFSGLLLDSNKRPRRGSARWPNG